MNDRRDESCKKHLEGEVKDQSRQTESAISFGKRTLKCADLLLCFQRARIEKKAFLSISAISFGLGLTTKRNKEWEKKEAFFYLESVFYVHFPCIKVPFERWKATNLRLKRRSMFTYFLAISTIDFICFDRFLFLFLVCFVHPFTNRLRANKRTNKQLCNCI